LVVRASGARGLGTAQQQQLPQQHWRRRGLRRHDCWFERELETDTMLARLVFANDAGAATKRSRRRANDDDDAANNKRRATRATQRLSPAQTESQYSHT
jgi:hypothetical protein